MNRHAIIPAVWMIIENEKGEYFMLRRANTGWRDGEYTIPAGHMEPREMPSFTACRELKEEAGIDVNPNDLELIHIAFYVADDGAHDRVSIFFKVNSYSGTPHLAEPHKADDSGWFHPNELPENTLKVLRDALAHIENGESYSEGNYSLND